MTVFPTEYAPNGRFVFSLDDQGQMLRHPLWQLECWLYRYTEYPQVTPPKMWLEIPGENLCFFQAYEFAKYIEALSAPARMKHQFGLKHRLGKCTDTGI